MKGDRISASVEHQVQCIVNAVVNQTGKLSCVRVAPIRQPARRTEPVDLRVRIKLLSGENRMRPAQGNHVLREAVDVLILFQVAPVIPAGFVILAIGVVITPLRASKFVTPQQHRHATRDEQR